MPKDYTYPSFAYRGLHRRYKVGKLPRVDASAVLHAFLQGIKGEIKVGVPIDGRIRTEDLAERVLAALNTPNMDYDSLLQIQSKIKHDTWQEWDYVRSNLGNGYVFYFLCRECCRKVKYLYEPEEKPRLLCWRCHGLRYPSPKRQPKPYGNFP